ncbi:hypothetical protein [Kribbella sp. NPDC048915]|uniref:hypothetical protein n=1 Tax=Kribbella sp. NPDC048915 TaxID=3155148 RepID=UPI0033F3D201
MIADNHRRLYIGSSPRRTDSAAAPKTPELPWNPAAQDAQLIGCIDTKLSTAEQQLCANAKPWENRQVDRFTSISYRFTLYELRTGRRIADATVKAAPRGDCGETVYLHQPDEYQVPGVQQYDQAIGSYVHN